jgi:phenylpropionate dioxygenase-like ring-hydroxylating dioxygenase large terminal subunit
MPDDHGSRLGRCPGLTTAEILANDTNPPPAFFDESVFPDAGPMDFSIDAYISPAFHQREVETVWRRCWQVACRADEVPNPGDFTVYDIAEDSVIVLRGRDGVLRGFVNSCPHRGTRLADGSGRAAQVRCGFHGITWSTEGDLKHLTCAWDFSEDARAKLRLPQVALGEWGGFVFVNFAPDPPPLLDYLEGLPEHFARWPLERRFAAAHVIKHLACNWKVTIEAFIETFHVIGLHPESLGFFGDVNSQYDVWPGKRHISRMINLSGVPSPHLGTVTPERTVAAAAKFGLCEDGPLAEGETPRQRIAARLRRFYGETFGVDLANISDCEVIDVIEYNLFPNLIAFGGFGSPLVYRSRPDGDDPNRSIFEVWLLLPVAEGAVPPPPAKLRVLADGERFADVPELSYYGPVLDQDADMMPRVQQGLRSSRKGVVTLSGYQESRIRHMRQTLAEYMGAAK